MAGHSEPKVGLHRSRMKWPNPTGPESLVILRPAGPGQHPVQAGLSARLPIPGMGGSGKTRCGHHGSLCRRPRTAVRKARGTGVGRSAGFAFFGSIDLPLFFGSIDLPLPEPLFRLRGQEPGEKTGFPRYPCRSDRACLSARRRQTLLGAFRGIARASRSCRTAEPSTSAIAGQRALRGRHQRESPQ